jgi:hypothetical protein
LVEIAALVRDVDRVAEGGAAARFDRRVRRWQNFFGNLVRLIDLEKKCLTVHADLSPDRRIYASGGQARALYAEAIKNLSTRTKPEGNVLPVRSVAGAIAFRWPARYAQAP